MFPEYVIQVIHCDYLMGAAMFPQLVGCVMATLTMTGS